MAEMLASVLPTAWRPVQDRAMAPPARVALVAQPIRWRRSLAVGLPQAGRLVHGVRLPSEGRDFFTWEAPLRRSPNRPWRRYGTARLVHLILRVARRFRHAHPEAPRLTVGDLSRPHGGEFGARFGGMGHRSHQNGIDVDVYYPRRDRRERAPTSVAQIDHRLAQALVRRFVAAGAQFVFVGTGTRLTGPPAVVQAIAHHDDHMHVRIRAPRF
jgi:murein endopeptidase